VETDLSLGNLVWFAQKALEKDSVNKLTFHSLPGNYAVYAYSRTLSQMQSYVTLYPNQLLTLINDSLNPYNTRISLGDLDLMSVNSDGTISSSTGTLADGIHNKVVLSLEPVEAGLAYFDSNWDLVYYNEEDDPNNNPEDGEDGEGEPGGGEPGIDGPAFGLPGPDEPGTDEPGTDEPGTGETPGEGETPIDNPGEGETPTGTPEDPNASGEPEPVPEPEDGSGSADPTQDPNYNPDPWAAERGDEAA